MGRRVTVLTGLIILLILHSVAWGASFGSDSGVKKVSVVPERFLRGYDPVTVFFTGDVGPEDAGVVDDPGDFFRIEPSHPGEYRWLDGRTLQFLPTIAWSALERYSVGVWGQAFELVTMMAPPVGIRPAAGSKDLEPFSEILLSFGGRLDLERLKSMISFEVKPLPGLSTEKGYWLSSRDFSIKEMERTAPGDPATYQVSLKRAVPYGHKLVMLSRLSLDDSHPGTFAAFDFSVKPVFRLTGMGAGSVRYPVAVKGSVYSVEQAIDGGVGKNSLYIEFSDRLGTVSMAQVKQLVRFEPAVRNFVYKVSGGKIQLLFECDRERTYKMTLKPSAIHDEEGRVLESFGETAAYFFYPAQKPFVKWQRQQGILELYGPQHFPMEVRGEDKLDVRIYKLDPLSRDFWPFPSDGVLVNESQRPAGPGEEPEYGSSMEEQIRQIGSPPVSRIIDLPERERGKNGTFDLNLKPLLTEISGKKSAGTYLVGFRELGGESLRNYIRVQVTDLSLSTIEEENAVGFVVTSLKTGAPVSGARVIVEGRDKMVDGKKERKIILSGMTDSSGIFRYLHTQRLKERIYRIVVEAGDDILVLDPALPPPNFHDNHWYGSYDTWLAWLGSDPVHYKNDTVLKGHLFTERPVYRPEEAVHIKGYLRTWKEGKLSLEKKTERKLLIQGPGGKSWTYPVTMSPVGSFYHKFEEKDLPTGSYTAYLYDGDVYNSAGSVSFSMENYRIPRFEVRLSGPDSVPLDRPFTLTLTADYYAGGRVTGQEVRWNVTEYTHTSSMPDYPGFLFSSDERFSKTRVPGVYGTTSKQDITDENGSAFLELDPAKAVDGRPRRYVVECTVRGADEQTVSTTKKVLALPPFVLGLKLERFVKDGFAINPELVAVGHDGKSVAGQEIRVRLLQRQWHSYLQQSDFTTGKATYVTDVVDNIISEKTVVSADKALKLNFNVEQAGVYVVELSGRDKLGRLQKVFADLYVSGDAPVTWEKPEKQVFESVWGKASYDPGETATLLLKSPFQQAHALVVVEKPDSNLYRWVDIKGGKGTFTIKALPEMTPKIAVHVLLMRGRLQKKGFIKRSDLMKSVTKSRNLDLLKSVTMSRHLNLLKPVTMASTSWLTVKPKGYRLNVTLDHPEKNLPGAEMPVVIRLSDPDGNPMNGEVTLWLADRAVLALGKERRLDPVPSFVQNAGSWVRIRDTRNEIIGELMGDEHPGGDGMAMEAASLFDKITVRRNFQTVPYYKPDIMVVNGEAKLKISLPDNLTDFAVRAVATGDNRFGFAKSMLSIRLPLIVQSALPRFVRPGDEFIAGGIGRVVEGTSGPGISEIDVTGVTLQGEKTRKIDWVKGVPEKVFFPMKVTTPAAEDGEPDNVIKVKLAVTRSSDNASDGFEISLPVKADRKREYRELMAELLPGKPLELPQPDEATRDGSIKSSVVLTGEPALIKMLAGLNYLAAYPHGCTEQRISRLIPELRLKDVLSKIGKGDRTASLGKEIREMIDYLESTLTGSGLFSFWPGSEGHVGLTAYVVEFLLLARDQGYEINTTLLERGITALKESLRSDYSYHISGYEYPGRAEALYALSLADEFDEAYAGELAGLGRNLDLYSEAKLLYAFTLENLEKEDAPRRMADDLRKSMMFRLDKGEERYEGLRYREQSWGGPILSSEARTLAGVTRTLYKISPEDKRVKLLIDELVSLGAGDGWGSTNANAAALTTLGDILGKIDPFHKGSPVRISSNGKEEMLDLSGKNMLLWESETAGGTLTRENATESKNPIAWMRLSYLPVSGGDQVRQKNSGFVVDQELLLFKDKTAPPEKFKVTSGDTLTFDMGSVVENHTRVINPEDRFYVAIQIPIAAGFDPMNPNLATAPPEAAPKGEMTLAPSYSLYEDDKVTFYYDKLPKGTFDFYFRLKATIAGSFTKPPALAEMMYRQSVFGRSDGTRIKIKSASGGPSGSLRQPFGDPPGALPGAKL